MRAGLLVALLFFIGILLLFPISDAVSVSEKQYGWFSKIVKKIKNFIEKISKAIKNFLFGSHSDKSKNESPSTSISTETKAKTKSGKPATLSHDVSHERPKKKGKRNSNSPTAHGGNSASSKKPQSTWYPWSKLFYDTKPNDTLKLTDHVYLDEENPFKQDVGKEKNENKKALFALLATGAIGIASYVKRKTILEHANRIFKGIAAYPSGVLRNGWLSLMKSINKVKISTQFRFSKFKLRLISSVADGSGDVIFGSALTRSFRSGRSTFTFRWDRAHLTKNGILPPHGVVEISKKTKKLRRLFKKHIGLLPELPRNSLVAKLFRSTKIVKSFRAASRIAFPVALAIDGYLLYAAYREDGGKGKRFYTTLGSVSGGWGGAILGAAIGFMVGGPVGALVGGIAGAYLGSEGGEYIAKKAIEAFNVEC